MSSIKNICSMFARWFQAGLISYGIVFFSHNKSASVKLISQKTNQRTDWRSEIFCFCLIFLLLPLSPYLGVLVDVRIHSIFNVPVHPLCPGSDTFLLRKYRAKTTNISGRREYTIVCDNQWRIQDFSLGYAVQKNFISNSVNPF